MSVVVSDRKLALSIAQRYAPIIYQEVTSVKDFILPFVYEPNDIKAEASLGLLITGKCTLYFGVREDNEYWYVYFLVYHPFDWSSSKIKFLRKMDEHRHDTESILYRVSKEEDETITAVTVAHYMFIFEKNHDRRVSIEKETHAINPFGKRPAGGNYIKYQVFNLIDLNRYTKKQWEDLRKLLKGNASMPQEQRDAILSSGMQGRKHHRKGDIFLRPEKVFWAGKRRGRF